MKGDYGEGEDVIFIWFSRESKCGMFLGMQDETSAFKRQTCVHTCTDTHSGSPSVHTLQMHTRILPVYTHVKMHTHILPVCTHVQIHTQVLPLYTHVQIHTKFSLCAHMYRCTLSSPRVHTCTDTHSHFPCLGGNQTITTQRIWI